MKLLPVLAALAATTAFAQGEPQAQRAAMDKLAWMAGYWEGAAVTTERDGDKRSLSQEWIRRAAGGLAVMIQGRHYRQLPDGQRGDLVFDTAGMLTFDTETGKYRFITQLHDGKGGAFEAVMNGETLSWRIPLAGAHIRYDIANERGQWSERGYFCRDGSPCAPFFRMVLDRKGDAP